MPIHEYRCASCGRRFVEFFRTFAEVRDPASCPGCGAAEVSRLPPRVRLLRSEESRLEDFAGPTSLGDLDENNPRSVARWAKRMGREMGDDLGPDFDEAVEAMESGEEASPAATGEAAGDSDGGLDDDESEL
jgi:putative FmdB family regulatory protein